MANPIPFDPFMLAQIIQAQAALIAQSQQIPQHQQMAMSQQFSMNPIFLNPSMNQQQQFSPLWMNNFGVNQRPTYPQLPYSPYEKKIVPKVNNKTAKILLDWFNAHIDHPYPEPEDRQMLREKTGFTDTQIGDWFRNRRRNVKKSYGGNAKWEAPATGRKRRSSSFFNFEPNDSIISTDSISTTTTASAPSTTPTPSIAASNPILSALLNAKPITVKNNANSSNSALSSSNSNDQSATSNTDTSTDDSGFIDVVSVADSTELCTSNGEIENLPPPEKRTKLWTINDIIE